MTTESIDTGPFDGGGPGSPFDQAPPVSAEMRPCASYTLRVNGFERPVTDAWIGESLLYVLRERLGLAGAKDGCEQGECGACSVQVDGQLVAGCLVPAALAADSEINTVEGLSAGGAASDVQQALAESGAVQCGYCTPGMAMAVHDLLQRNHRPSEVEARQALCGNLCRCTGYRGVLAAVQNVAEARAAESEQDDEPAPPAADPGGAPAEAEQPPARPVATEQSAADLPLAGELPLYADSEAWVEYEPQPPGPQQSAPDGYGGRPTAAGTGLGTGLGHGAGHPQAGPSGTGYDSSVYDTAVLPPVQSIPAQQNTEQVPYQQSGQQQPGHQQPGHQHPGQQQSGYPGAPYPGTQEHGGYRPGQFESGPYGAAQGQYQLPQQQPGPQHGAPYPGPAYRSGEYDAAEFGHAPYDGPVYESTPAHGTAFDGPGPEGTPAQGTPYVPTPPHGVPTGGAPADVPYGATPAHGIRLPEDDHA
ncbi:2Fe-2S iron-sulfur cluster-binding protein [Kitasatospora sp. NBC_00315]|uniref:(2Fe-2S)-binding protein n=1 Tax=Kitasatospora sp. NBC_00315 TaxID=2975963 RepID=UPI00352DC481